MHACMVYLFETAVPVTGPSSGVGHAIRPRSLSTAACTWQRGRSHIILSIDQFCQRSFNQFQKVSGIEIIGYCSIYCLSHGCNLCQLSTYHYLRVMTYLWSQGRRGRGGGGGRGTTCLFSHPSQQCRYTHCCVLIPDTIFTPHTLCSRTIRT